MAHKCEVLVLGAGAAGLMCAIEAGKRGRRVTVIERAERTGKKILISGGGRCNFTNLHCLPENFISANPHFAKSALARYTPSDFLALVEKHRIAYHEKSKGQLFCDHSAHEIVEMLESECRVAGVQISLNCDVREVSHDGEFVVRTDSAEFRAPVLVVATGGLSIPKIGATPLGYDLARQFGLKVHRTKPALTPLVLGPEDRKDYCDLAGVTADVIASVDRISFREKMLITHRGLSGPAILQISSYWEQSKALRIDLAPDRRVICATEQPVVKPAVKNVAAVRSALREILPARLAARWAALHAPSSWTKPARADLEEKLHGWILKPAGTEGYDKAEVTAGGVDTDELSSKTMESKKQPGLFFIGEVVDVTGQLGGFNFQWAWASGVAAGRSL